MKDKRKLLPLAFAVSLGTAGMAQAVEITFHNDTDAVVHLDYTDCTSTPAPDNKNFLPHSTVKFSCASSPNIQLAQYSGPEIGSRCYFPDNGTNKNCIISGNTVTLKWPAVHVDYAKMQNNVQTVVNGFNSLRKDGLTLIPNVIPLTQAHLEKEISEKWALQFSYDASRYPLFNGAYCLAHPSSATCIAAKPILSGLLETISKVTQNFTLPSAGVWAYPVGTAKAGDPVEGSAYPASTGGSPALDGPMAVAELAINGKDSPFYQGLLRTLSNYSLSQHTPASAKNEGFMASTSPYFNGSLALLSQALLVGNGDLENTRKLPSQRDGFASKGSFMDNYQAWVNSGFLSEFGVTDQNGTKVPGLRVIFTVQNAPHTASDNWENAGDSSTVSEGMAYGLLIAYAADDHVRFNQFLNYILFEAYNHGCAGMNELSTACSIKTQYLMPWLVDQTGRPFHYTIGGGYLTNGSATDADVNIAWALKMAAAREAAGVWPKYSYAGEDYVTLANKMQAEIARYDVNKDVTFFGTAVGPLYGPGSQWGTAGKEVLYPGYDAPQAFDALAH